MGKAGEAKRNRPEEERLIKKNQQKLVRGRVWEDSGQGAEDSRQARGPLVNMGKGDEAILHSLYGVPGSEK